MNQTKSPKPTQSPLNPATLLASAKAINKQTRPRANSTGKVGCALRQAVSQHYSASAITSPVGNRRVKGNSNSFDLKNNDTFEDAPGGSAGWSIKDMFNANSKITGLSYQYDGNPHEFGNCHPKYINYNSLSNHSSPLLRGVAMMEERSGIADFSELSQQSTVAHKLLHPDKLPSETDPMPNFSLPKSASCHEMPIPSGREKTTPNSNTRENLIPDGRAPGQPSLIFPSLNKRKWFTSAFANSAREDIMGEIDKVLAETQSLIC